MKLAKKFALVTLLVVSVALLGITGGPVQAADKYKLQIQTAVPNASIYFQLIQRMAQRVDDMSAGRLNVEVLPAGAIVPVFEILDAVEGHCKRRFRLDPLLVREESGRPAFLRPYRRPGLWPGPARNHVLAV